MARPCMFCGVFFQDSEELEFHEQLHRDLDFLNGNVSDVAFQVVSIKYISPNNECVSMVGVTCVSYEMKL